MQPNIGPLIYIHPAKGKFSTRPPAHFFKALTGGQPFEEFTWNMPTPNTKAIFLAPPVNVYTTMTYVIEVCTDDPQEIIAGLEGLRNGNSIDLPTNWLGVVTACILGVCDTSTRFHGYMLRDGLLTMQLRGDFSGIPVQLAINHRDYLKCTIH